MSFFSFSKIKISDEEISNKIDLINQNWFFSSSSFGKGGSQVEILARFLLEFEKGKKFRNSVWDKNILNLKLFLDNSSFKASVFINKLIPVEMIFAVEILDFIENNNFNGLNSSLEFYGYDSRILKIMFNDRNLEHVVRKNKLDVFINLSKKRNENFNLEDISKIISHYKVLKKFFSKRFEFDKVGKSILKKLSNSNFIYNSINLRRYEFEIYFPEVYNSVNFRGEKFHGEGEFSIMLNFKKKFSYSISFDIVDLDEIVIKSVQGVYGNNLDSQIDFNLVLINLILEFAKYLDFKIVSMVGLQTNYMRPYCGEHYYNYSKQVEVEKKYDAWAKKLGFEFVDGLWKKRTN